VAVKRLVSFSVPRSFGAYEAKEIPVVEIGECAFLYSESKFVKIPANVGGYSAHGFL
jgi:hypothetical protein